ncbi:MAG: helix-turn-helix domain-containing protein [Actinobacteria bacterium]|nr:helix-turn-helix domain-containing protein [Actinomycetota bacterium]
MDAGEQDERRARGRAALGERLRSLRQQAGWGLAEMADASGLSVGFVSDAERGRRLPTLDTLDPWCHALGLTVADALAGVWPYGAPDPAPRQRRSRD